MEDKEKILQLIGIAEDSLTKLNPYLENIEMFRMIVIGLSIALVALLVLGVIIAVRQNRKIERLQTLVDNKVDLQSELLGKYYKDLKAIEEYVRNP